MSNFIKARVPNKVLVKNEIGIFQHRFFQFELHVVILLLKTVSVSSLHYLAYHFTINFRIILPDLITIRPQLLKSITNLSFNELRLLRGGTSCLFERMWLMKLKHLVIHLSKMVIALSYLLSNKCTVHRTLVYWVSLISVIRLVLI